MRRSLAALLAIAGMVALAAGCGGSDGPKIALLLPGNQTAGYEAATRDAFERAVEEECGGCEVLYSNAAAESSKQTKQVKAALRQGAEALVLDPVSSPFAIAMVEEAKKRGVPVLDYGERIPKAEASTFVGFDFVRTGEMQGEALAEKLREEGHAAGPIVMVKGEPGNSDQRLFEAGAHRALEAVGVRIAREYYTPFWYERYAKHEMQRAIRKLGKQGFAGVYAETDSIAGGVIAALRSAGIDPAKRPTTGRNASQAAVRRIIAGEQDMTVYEPPQREASAGAEIALDLARGGPSPAGRAILVPGVALDKGSARQKLSKFSRF